jgi:hypothetical protein
LKDAIDASRNFFCAAGNNGKNIDTFPEYPAALTSENIISVAATDQDDNLTSFQIGVEFCRSCGTEVNIKYRMC